jgi:hypothetical protein
MKLRKSPDEIIINHIPIGKWIVGGIFTFIFSGFCLWHLSIALSTPQWFFSTAPKDWLEMFPLMIFVVTLVLIAVFEISFLSMICAPLTTVCINKQTKSIDIIRRRFYGSKTERFYFHQIQKFKSYKAKLNFSSKYFLALVLANQKTIKLKIPINGDKRNTIKLVKTLNKFIKLPYLS